MKEKPTTLIENIRKLLDYSWRDEQKHFYESGCPPTHIFITLKSLRDEFELSDSYMES